MGERGPVGRNVGHRKKLVVKLVPKVAEPPPPPAGLLLKTRRDWQTFWASDVSRLVQDVDLPDLERWFTLLDEWRRLLRAHRSGRFVEGSAGQVAISPAARHMAVLESGLDRIGRKFGIGPMSRARLGLTVGALHRTLDELNAEATVSVGDEPDPREEAIAHEVEREQRRQKGGPDGQR